MYRRRRRTSTPIRGTTRIRSNATKPSTRIQRIDFSYGHEGSSRPVRFDDTGTDSRMLRPSAFCVPLPAVVLHTASSAPHDVESAERTHAHVLICRTVRFRSDPALVAYPSQAAHVPRDTSRSVERIAYTGLRRPLPHTSGLPASETMEPVRSFHSCAVNTHRCFFIPLMNVLARYSGSPSARISGN